MELIGSIFILVWCIIGQSLLLTCQHFSHIDDLMFSFLCTYKNFENYIQGNSFLVSPSICLKKIILRKVCTLWCIILELKMLVACEDFFILFNFEMLGQMPRLQKELHGTNTSFINTFWTIYVMFHREWHEFVLV